MNWLIFLPVLFKEKTDWIYRISGRSFSHEPTLVGVMSMISSNHWSTIRSTTLADKLDWSHCSTFSHITIQLHYTGSIWVIQFPKTKDFYLEMTWTDVSADFVTMRVFVTAFMGRESATKGKNSWTCRNTTITKKKIHSSHSNRRTHTHIHNFNFSCLIETKTWANTPTSTQEALELQHPMPIH